MIDTEDMTKEERAEYWALVMEEFASGRLTKTDYCKQNDIPVSTFNYWARRLDELKQETENGNRFVELKSSQGEKHAISVTNGVSGMFVPEIALDYAGVRILANTMTPMKLLTTVLGELGYA